MNSRPAESATSPGAPGRWTRRSFLKLGAAGLGLAGLGESASRSAALASPGRIYAYAKLRTADGVVEGLIAINPDPCSWELLAAIPDATLSTSDANFRISPDGKQLAFTRFERDAAGRPEDPARPVGVFLVDFPRGAEPRKVRGECEFAAWAPDGKSLFVHERHRYEPGHASPPVAWRVAQDGSNATRLPIPKTDEISDCAASGRLITISVRHHDEGMRFVQLYAMNPDGTAERRLTRDPHMDDEAKFSPDGSRIVYRHNESRGKDVIWSIRVVGADGGAPRTIFEGTQETIVFSPCWSPDGKALASRVSTRKGGPSGPTVDRRLMLFDLAAPNPRPLPLPEILRLPCIDWR